MNVDNELKKEGGKHYVSMLYNGSTAWNRSGNSLCLQVIIPRKIEREGGFRTKNATAPFISPCISFQIIIT